MLSYHSHWALNLLRTSSYQQIQSMSYVEITAYYIYTVLWMSTHLCIWIIYVQSSQKARPQSPVTPLGYTFDSPRWTFMVYHMVLQWAMTVCDGVISLLMLVDASSLLMADSGRQPTVASLYLAVSLCMNKMDQFTCTFVVFYLL